MLGCLSTGVSGLSASNNGISIIANNIANVNTPGYKAQRANFADVFFQQSGSLAIGSGVNINNVSSALSQGALDATNNATDLAIDGSGFFVVKDDSGTFYTRAGQFHFDQEGKLVTPQGQVVQGWDLRENQNLARLPSDINVSSLSLPAKPTENISMSVNLDANAAIPTAAFDITNPASTSNYSTSVSVYDSLGNRHNVTFYFRKSAENPATPPNTPASNEWEWHAVLNEGGTQTEQASGKLTFNDQGSLVSESATTYTNGTGFNFGSGVATNQAISIDFGSSINEGGKGIEGSTQFATDFSTAALVQDGYESGSLLNISIGRDGVIQGILTNGHTQDIARIALADFNNPDGLQKAGNNLYLASQESGQPAINPPGTGGKGEIVAYNLEGSNVDLAAEFVKMIVTQRAFQANARTITTADQLLTELVNLKR